MCLGQETGDSFEPFQEIVPLAFLLNSCCACTFVLCTYIRRILCFSQTLGMFLLLSFWFRPTCLHRAWP
ncbi:hypothetical protein BD289DRAFT_421806 [Coniella lustricola]|uniref:Uncharacterized protein n=1 Tax=Coniella lustricola TaxID=2025994 RepID=A0A2T3ALQ5_9PEZI|nr:hypothetical protein BD289DRAFT_421806 [Coniella lustricola]